MLLNEIIGFYRICRDVITALLFVMCIGRKYMRADFHLHNYIAFWAHALIISYKKDRFFVWEGKKNFCCMQVIYRSIECRMFVK